MPIGSESKSRTVLIVEDEQDICELYAEVLTNAGYVVDKALDGATGLDKIKSSQWNLLLLDIMLPGKDGLRILKEVKENPDYKKGPLIILTNLKSDHIIQEAFNTGADGYLIKSEFTPDKVVEEVDKYLSSA